MVNTRLRYCGKLTVGEKGLGERPSISCIDLSLVPAKIGSGNLDLLACVGNTGTYVYRRATKSTQDMEHGWQKVYHSPSLQGNLCKWHPKQAILAVATTHDDLHAQLYRLEYSNRRETFDRASIFTVPSPDHDISSFSWNHNGNMIIIFVQSSPVMHSMKWRRGPDKVFGWWTEHKDIPYAVAPYTFSGCCHPTRGYAVAGSLNSRIYGFTSRENILTGASRHWDHTFDGNEFGNSCFTFSVDGQWLATICENNSVRVWALRPPVPPQRNPSLVLSQTIPTNNPSFLTFSRRYSIATSGRFLQSISIFRQEENKDCEQVGGAEMVWVKQIIENRNNMGIEPFNLVHHMIWHPRKINLLATAGNDGFIFFWEKFNRYEGKERLYVEEKLSADAVGTIGAFDDFVGRFSESHKYLLGCLEKAEIENSVNREKMISASKETNSALERIYGGNELTPAETRSHLEKVAQYMKFN